ncbi:hypothetical protein [Bradyrhizobium sp. Ce-3]|uniref:hypothetical protein n=1 Tax=Bradyrhizobium sp. Ce-3 TaxID=2913970 RepID=UPI001FC8E301|nr:hypothetical protein [Bradyrhizobium sp. Ce-3]
MCSSFRIQNPVVILRPSCSLKDGAVLWRKHGADVSYWSVIGGEVGNYAFVARFDRIEAYGRSLASLGADPAFAEFQAKRLKAGQSEWVRSNLSVQVDV